MHRVSVNLTDDLHQLLKRYAEEMGISLTAWIIFALNTRAASWSQLKSDGKLHGGRNKGSGKKITKKEVATKEATLGDLTQIYENQTDCLTGFVAKEGNQPYPNDPLGVKAWDEKYHKWLVTHGFAE